MQDDGQSPRLAVSTTRRSRSSGLELSLERVGIHPEFTAGVGDGAVPAAAEVDPEPLEDRGSAEVAGDDLSDGGVVVVHWRFLS
jgi:hypothetical protein